MLLEVKDVSKAYATSEGPLQVLRGVSFAVDRAESVALTGESGSGKSTLLHLVGGLDRPEAGTILFEGRDVAKLGEAELAAHRRSSVGLVFQQFNLIPSLHVAANLAFQARLAGRYDAAWCALLADRLGLSALLGRYPEQLSGGQQQRVAIGRALALRPPLILADEPTGNLDPETSRDIMDLLDRINRTGTTVLMATHDHHIVDSMRQRVVELSLGRLVRDEQRGVYGMDR